MPNIYQNINSNKRDTVVIMALFIAVICFIGWFFGTYFSDTGATGFISFALIISGISSFFSYYNSDKIVLAISGAKEVTSQEASDLHNLVENMSIASGIPKPRVFIIEDAAMNAFATGRDPQHSAICFTAGILQRLEKRELEGVISHEMSHIGNYDTRLMSIVSILVGCISLLGHWFTRGAFRGRRRSNGEGDLGELFLIVGIIFIILSPIIATLIKLAISRKREYLADSTGALITRYPKGLADALKKLGADTEVLRNANGATAHLYIANPYKSKLVYSLTNLFDTHPPIKERIRRLEEM